MADGQVLIDSKLDTKGVQEGVRKIKNEMDALADVTARASEAMQGELKDSGDALQDFLKMNITSNAIVEGLKMVGEAAVELAKQAIAAATEVNASNAQFEQTFKGVEGVARESLNRIAEQAGITATRMQDSYTRIFAFTKTTGADTETALNISSRAMEAAADVAAYYDMSIEDATATLQSFLKGNYENDAALGIAATETTRNTAANKKYAKSFNELSESQKVDVLLSMVEAGNAASGALGQAAREADSWTNVAGELAEAWRLLLAALGDPILEGLIPIVQGITDGIKKLIEVTASENLAAGMQDFKDSIGDINAEFEAEAQTIEKNALLADYYKTRLVDLEAAGLDTAESQREYANAIAALNALYPELNLQLDEQTGLLNENSRAQLSNLEAMKQKALFAAQEKQYTATLEEQANAVLAVQEAERSLQGIQAERAVLEQQLMELSGKSAEELAWAYEHRIMAASDMGYAELKLLDQIIPLVKEESKLNAEIAAGNETIQSYDATLEKMAATLQGWAGQHSESVGDVSAATEAAVTGTAAVVAEGNAAMLDQMQTDTVAAVEGIAREAGKTATAVKENLTDPVADSVKTTGAVTEEAFSTVADTVEESFVDTAPWFEANVETPIVSSVVSLKESAIESQNEIEQQTRESWNRMVQDVADAVRRMQDTIDRLQGKEVPISIRGSGLPTSAPTSYTPAVHGITPVYPMLASGTVIPPLAVNAGKNTLSASVLDEESIRRLVLGMQDSQGDIVTTVNLTLDGEMAALARVIYPEIKAESRRRGSSLAEAVSL